MVLTGVEIAGIALAVIPICISILNHHQDELKPFKSLLSYEKVAQEERTEFGIIYAEFEQAMQEIVEDLNLSTAKIHKLFGCSDKALEASDWSDKELEEIFILHFGAEIYRNSFTPLLGGIFEDIKGISCIIGLSLSPNTLDACTVWHELDTAKKDLNAKFSGSAIKSEVKKRAKLALRVGLLDSKREALSAKVARLSRIRTGARRLSATRASRKPFRWPLTRLRKHAVELYSALSEVLQRCTSNTSHCINLQMNCRLRFEEGSQGKGKEPQEQQTSFTLAVASNTTAQDWYAIKVIMEDDPFVKRIRKAGRARSAARGGPSCRAVNTCICAALTRSLEVSFCVDPKGHLYEKPAAPDEAIVAWSPAEWTSMKTVLESEYDKGLRDPDADADLDDASSTMLALTLASSFLQLCSTDWVTDSWNTDGVMFRRQGTATTYDPAYITLSLANGSQTAVSNHCATFNQKLLSLAAMLLEIGANKPMAQCRAPNDLDERDTIKRCLAEGQLDDEWPGFKQAISYCVDWHCKQGDADPPNTEALLEIVGGVVLPLQRDLESFHMCI